MDSTPTAPTSNPSFVHLHLHSQYSLLDGAIRIDDLVAKAREFEMPAVAVTDHGNMFGAIDFYEQALKAGIKPILGSEIYFTPGTRFDRKPPKKTQTLSTQDAEEGKFSIHHLILLVKNQTGYLNLCKILSHAYLEGFYYKPRADIELLKKYSEGLVATTACLKGEVGSNFFMDQDERAQNAVFKLREIFKDDFYLEVQINGLDEQEKVNEKILPFAKQHSIPIVATNDCHYLTKEDARAQEVLLCIQTGKTLNDDKRMKLTTSEFYFKSAEEMRKNFHFIPEACDNTLIIANKCNLKLSWKDAAGKQIYHLPDYPVAINQTLETCFREASFAGLKKRFLGPHFIETRKDPHFEEKLKPAYEARLADEVEMIIKMGFAGYFMIVADFIGYAKKNDIPVGPGRGSGAGSLVAYALEITNIDPIPFNLLFERFINPERVSLPDFDVDFCQERRGEVIQYVTQKYGAERVGQIITFGKLQAKAVIRDVGRVFDIPYSEVDALAKLIPDELGITLNDAKNQEPKLSELINSDAKIAQVYNISLRLEGLLRHASIHAAGVIITNRPLVEYCPLFRGREGEQVVQFDKDFSEKIGLVKFDFLGLKTLTVIKWAQDFIRRDIDPDFDIEKIPLNDPKVYQFISEGKTIGVFQLESAGMIDLCKRIRPDSLEDITAINALYRPGPLESGMVDDFIERKHGRKETNYAFPELQPILKDTYGVIVYQEQVMNVARVIAGYTLGQADMLRRAMGKKKAEVMEENKKVFVEGAINLGFDEKKASDLFDLMAKFAAYGFNKSHAVAYGFIAYQTAYLKCYYPAQFFAALLSSEMSNSDKITLYINDARASGIEVLPPDINESNWYFNVIASGEKSSDVRPRVRFGMGAVKNVGEGAVEALMKVRKEGGNFKGLLNFLERMDFKSINKRVLESLIKVGVFDELDRLNRKTLLTNLEVFLNFSQKLHRQKEVGQTSIFDHLLENTPEDEKEKSVLSQLSISEVDDFLPEEKLSQEKELLGIFVSGHPLSPYQNVIEQLTSSSIWKIQDMPVPSVPQNSKPSRPGMANRVDREFTIAGILLQAKKLLTKKGDKMCFATIEDFTGKIECILFPKTFKEFEDHLDHWLESNEPLLLTGVVNMLESPRKFFPNTIVPLKKVSRERVNKVKVSLSLEDNNPVKLKRMKEIVLSHRGMVAMEIIFNTESGKVTMPLSDFFMVNPGPQLAVKINDLFERDVVEYVVGGS